MKILVFVKKFMSPTLLFIYNEIQELSKTNEVLLLTTSRLKEYEEDFPFENIHVIPYEFNKVRNKINWMLETNDILIPAKNAAFRKKLNNLVNTFKPDIIHAHFGYEAITLLDNLAGYDGPVFVTLHGYDASAMLRSKAYIKKLNFLINKLKVTPLFVSNETGKDLVQAGVNMSKGRLLYCGVNTDYFNPLPQITIHGKFTFLQISSFSEKKGQIYTLRAFKTFLDSVENKNKYRLIIAGEFSSSGNIKMETEKLKLSDYIEFKDTITYKEAYALLQQADAFVHHSVTASNGNKEGLPTSIMEAMAMELPVISTWHAGIPELVEDGVNGYLVKERNVETYAKRMKDILTWQRQPQNRLKVQEHFSVNVHNKNLLALYNEAFLK